MTRVTVKHDRIPAWTSARLPAPPPPSFGNFVRVIGPAVILLGTSIGSDRPSRCSAVRHRSARNRYRGRRAANDLQHRGHAIHGEHGRTDTNGVHAAREQATKLGIRLYSLRLSSSGVAGIRRDIRCRERTPSSRRRRERGDPLRLRDVRPRAWNSDLRKDRGTHTRACLLDAHVFRFPRF